MDRIFKIVLWSLEWQWGEENKKNKNDSGVKKTKIRSIKNIIHLFYSKYLFKIVFIQSNTYMAASD